MPHVIVEGPCSVESYHASFQPTVLKDAGLILKTRDCYLNTRRTQGLVEGVVVEDRRPQSFFISLTRKDNGVLVRLSSSSRPEKTDGVKRLIAAIAAMLKRQHADCRYGTTNLQDYLVRE